MVDKQSEQILCVVPSPDSEHDFKIYRESMGSAVSSSVLLKADSGYQGLLTFHANSQIPFKKSKNHPLSAEEKLANRRLSSDRMLVEHINRRIKIFKIISSL